MNNYEGFAVSVIIVFGALIIGGLMAANITVGDEDGFLFALGAAGTAWLSGHAVLFARPRIYGLLVIATAALCVASIILFVR
jgi:hypothetical protein